jgi:hypothetical protein
MLPAFDSIQTPAHWTTSYYLERKELVSVTETGEVFALKEVRG